MAYVDHAFSISDEDIMMETSYAVSNKPPIKEISLALALFLVGAIGIVLGIFMAINEIGGDRAHDEEYGGRSESCRRGHQMPVPYQSSFTNLAAVWEKSIRPWLPFDNT